MLSPTVLLFLLEFGSSYPTVDYIFNKINVIDKHGADQVKHEPESTADIILYSMYETELRVKYMYIEYIHVHLVQVTKYVHCVSNVQLNLFFLTIENWTSQTKKYKPIISLKIAHTNFKSININLKQESS